jgi:hypothetical protein
MLATSNPPTPRGRKHVEVVNASASATQSQSAPEQRGTESAPLFVQSLPAPESASDAAHKEYEHHQKPALERRLTVATEVLAFFTFLLFCFTAALWWVNYRLFRDAKTTGARQANEMKQSLQVAEKTALAAQAAAAAAQSQVQVAAEDLRRSHRAWVGLHESEMTNPLVFDDSGARFKIRLVAMNGGDSVAKRLAMKVNFTVVPGPHEDPRTMVEVAPPEKGFADFVTSGGFGVFLLPSYTFTFNHEGSLNSFAVGKDGTVAAFLSVSFVYSDEFGLSHTTSLLMKYATESGGGNFLPQGTINGAFEVYAIGGHAD